MEALALWMPPWVRMATPSFSIFAKMRRMVDSETFRISMASASDSFCMIDSRAISSCCCSNFNPGTSETGVSAART